MHFLVGTSGYSYQEWKGPFYPEKLSPKKMLAYYGEHFATVEINSTFRRFPSASTVAAWAAEVPASFRFVFKAHQTVTHFRRLVNAESQIDDFLALAALLGERQGPLLFQLPGNFKKDLGRLDAFLKYVRRRARVAMEFRHASWLDEETYELLRAHDAALAVAEADDAPECPLVATAGWGYIRLREESYSDAALRGWLDRLRDQPWSEAYVFFKHEDAGAGPKLAERFLGLAAKPAAKVSRGGGETGAGKKTVAGRKTGAGRKAGARRKTGTSKKTDAGRKTVAGKKTGAGRK